MARELLVSLLSSDLAIRVVATADNRDTAIKAVSRHRPNVIAMGIHVPGMDVLDAARRIMETTPTPIVIVSDDHDPKEVAVARVAMEAGAVAFLRRPIGIGHLDHDPTARELLQIVKLMSEVKVIRRWPQTQHEASAQLPIRMGLAGETTKARVVAIGASTGGPAVLKTIIASLPKDFSTPVLIVQHMATGFVGGFIDWLKESSSLPIHLATHNAPILPGHVYIAPDSFHMKVESGDRVALITDEPEHGLRPSVSYLFRSVAEVYGRYAIAGLLTGMGRDGAEELLLLKEKGAVTFAQDKDSSVVYGMAGEAVRLDATTLVLTPERIAPVLTHLVKNIKRE